MALAPAIRGSLSLAETIGRLTFVRRAGAAAFRIHSGRNNEQQFVGLTRCSTKAFTDCVSIFSQAKATLEQA
jgi:hypothetical protein